MADIEKVTKGLQYCTKTDGNQCPKCPYFDGECTEELSKDALELLKEQQPVKPEIEGSSNTWWYVCGDCHTSINPNAKYCHQCGHKVMWDSN